MAVLKAFVCQIILLGLYKLFLEQVVEEYLVPDEVTRNCLVGFVCLICFGIQLCTEKDEDSDEADEESKSCGKTNAKKSEPAEIPVAYKADESNFASRVTTAKPPTTSKEIAREMKMSPNGQRAVDLRDRNNAVLLPEAEKVIDVTNYGLFYQFSANISNKTPNGIKEDEMREQVETALVSNEQENKTTIPVFNGISETIVCEESDEDGIKIDQFVNKESEKVEQLITIEADEIEVIKPGDASEKAQVSRIIEVEVVKTEDETEKDQELRTVEVETIKHEDVEEAIIKSKCVMVNGENILSMKDSDETAVPKIVESEKSRILSISEVEVVDSEDETEENQKLRTVEVETIKHEDVPEAAAESKCLTVNGENIQSAKDSDETTVPKIDESEKSRVLSISEIEVVDSEDETEENQKSRTVEVETIKHEDVPEAAAESKCLMVNGENIQSAKDSDENTVPKIDESETDMTSGIYNELSKDTDSVSSRICKDIESKESVKDEAEAQIISCPTPESDEFLNITESPPSVQETNSSSSSAKTVNNVATTNTDNVKSSILSQNEASSPSEKSTLSSTQNIATAGDLCLPTITIDISFIYACH